MCCMDLLCIDGALFCRVGTCLGDVGTGLELVLDQIYLHRTIYTGLSPWKAPGCTSEYSLHD